MFGNEEENKEICAAEIYYREVGWFLIKREGYRASFPSFDKAVELTPTDLRTLIGRAYARLKTTHYACAIEDLNNALKSHTGQLTVLEYKALCKFLRTDFEISLVHNKRGQMLRTMPDNFRLLALTCAEEIERSIGKRTGHCLRDHYDVIRTIAWKKALDLRKGKVWKPRLKKRTRKSKKSDNTPPLYINYMKATKHLLQGSSSSNSILESLTDYGKFEYDIKKKKKSHFQPPQPHTSNITNKMSEQYLERMYLDKMFLRQLKEDPRILSPNYEGYVKLKTLARKSHRSIAYRQNILRARQPFYTIVYNSKIRNGNVLRRQEIENGKTTAVIQNDTEKLIKLLRAARESYLTNTAIEIAQKTKVYIDKKSNKYLPNKEMYLKQLYELIGLVYLDNYRLKEETPDWDPIKRINFLFGLPISREPSQDSVIKQNRKKFFIREAYDIDITTVEKRLAKATTPLETVWHYYELSKLNLDIKKYDLSRFYARKSLNMAKVLDNNVWATNVNILIASAHVRQNNRNEAKNELIKSLEFATKLNCPDIIAYIQKCLGLVDKLEVGNQGTDLILLQREQEIQRALTDLETRKSAQILFDRIDAMPGLRRMSIMPGVHHTHEPVRKSDSLFKPSIIPKSEEEIEFIKQMPQKKGMELLYDI